MVICCFLYLMNRSDGLLTSYVGVVKYWLTLTMYTEILLHPLVGLIKLDRYFHKLPLL